MCECALHGLHAVTSPRAGGRRPRRSRRGVSSASPPRRAERRRSTRCVAAAPCGRGCSGACGARGGPTVGGVRHEARHRTPIAGAWPPMVDAPSPVARSRATPCRARRVAAPTRCTPTPRTRKHEGGVAAPQPGRGAPSRIAAAQGRGRRRVAGSYAPSAAAFAARNPEQAAWRACPAHPGRRATAAAPEDKLVLCVGRSTMPCGCAAVHRSSNEAARSHHRRVAGRWRRRPRSGAAPRRAAHRHL